MKFQFVWRGVPRGQERPRFGQQVYKSSEAKAYEQSIALAFHAYRSMLKPAGKWPLEEPVGIRIAAGYPIPASDSAKARMRKESGAELPAKKPDLDNVVKAVLDALNGLAWADDKQVVCLTAYKMYASAPGLIVTIVTGEALEEMRG